MKREPIPAEKIALAKELYEAAQHVWFISPYYKKWEKQSRLMIDRYLRYADELIKRGLIK